MPNDFRPISVRFFPASRLGLVVGAVVGALTAFAVRASRDEAQPVVVPDVVAVAVADVVAPPPALPATTVVQRGSLHGPAVINVWLQGCADCMPAFAAWRDFAAGGGADAMNVVNVAYGSARGDFSRDYRVNQHLIVDGDGTLIVQRLGIGTFTTLVVNAAGDVVLRDRPDSEGFGDRLRAAWHNVQP